MKHESRCSRDCSNRNGNEDDKTYVRHAHTVMALLSGGRAIPGLKILHRISGWVKHIPDPYTEAQPAYLEVVPYEGYTWYHNLPTMPNSSVHLLGDTLHDDPNFPAYPDEPVTGTLFYVTPAGAPPVKFTPTVFGDNFYAWGVNAWGGVLQRRAEF